MAEDQSVSMPSDPGFSPVDCGLASTSTPGNRGGLRRFEVTKKKKPRQHHRLRKFDESEANLNHRHTPSSGGSEKLASSVLISSFLANRRARGETAHTVRHVRTLHKRRLRPPPSRQDDLEPQGAKSPTPPHLSPDWGAGNSPEPFPVLWSSGYPKQRSAFPSLCT